MSNSRVLCGDVLTELKALPSASFDAAFSDPPYGLKFLGLDWDKVLPSQLVWIELARVLKPGANVLIFGGTRTFHRLAVGLENVGFSIVDVFMWLYSQGMPKAKGSIKPAWEPIILARNAGGVVPLNIDGCRVGGRWPANVIVDAESSIVVDSASGIRKSGAMRVGTMRAREDSYSGNWGGPATAVDIEKSEGGASRFFYCSKVKGNDRKHPTQKPTDLTEWLARLLFVPNGQLLIPYSGVGSEMVGAIQAGWLNVTGIELNNDYTSLSCKRVAEIR